MSLTKLPRDGLYFLPLGGTNAVGMNFGLYGCDGQWLAVDLGMGFGSLPWQEVLLPDPTPFVACKLPLKGLVVTHAHEDHLGGIPYLWPHLRCPIYGTKFSISLIREKLEEFDFLDEVPFIEVAPQASVEIGNFNVQFIPVTHSVPGASILAIETARGRVIHTGDWRLDHTPPIGLVTDAERLKYLGKAGVRALVCDSTNVFEENASESEASVRARLKELVGKYPGKNIVITCFASNVARLESCALAALAHGRRPVLVGRSLKRIERVARSSGYLKGITQFLEEKNARDFSAEKVLYICTGSQGEGRSALSRIAQGAHPSVQLQEGDVVIFSSREIPGNELAISEMQNLLARSGVRSLTVRHYDVHVSGHPSREELRELYSWVRPEIVVPIHGGARQLLEHADFARSQGIAEVLVPHDGLLLRLDRGQAGVVGEMEARQLVVDGDVLLPLKGKAQTERLRGASEGIIFVTFLRKGRKKTSLKVSSYGLFEDAEVAEEENLFEAIREKLEGLSREGDLLQKNVRSVVQKIFFKERGKKPQVILHVF